MKRLAPWIILPLLLGALQACGSRVDAAAPATGADAAVSPANVVVAGGPSDRPMDSIRAGDAPDNADEIAARMRDAQLPR